MKLSWNGCGKHGLADKNPRVIVGLATPALPASFISPFPPPKKGSVEAIEERKKYSTQ